MIFKAQKALLQSVVDPLSKILTNNGPDDPSRFLGLKSGNDSVTIYAARQDIAGKVVIDKASGILTTGDVAALAMDPVICALLAKLGRSVDITSKLVPMKTEAKKETKKEDGEEVEDAGPKLVPVGSLHFTVPSLNKTPETWKVPCVEAPVEPTIDTSGTDRVTVSSEELAKYIKQVGVAVGKDTGNTAFRNVMLRVSGSDFELVTLAQAKLARTKAAHLGSSGDFSFIAPYETMALAAGVLDPERNVEIIFNKGANSTVVFSQSISYGDNEVGSLVLRVRCSQDPFAKFEKTLDALDFKTVLKFKREAAAEVLGRVATIRDSVRMDVVVDAAENEVHLNKTDTAGRGCENMSFPLTSITGEPVAFEFSTETIKDFVACAEDDEIEWHFAGPKSLSLMVLSNNLRAYCQPFGPVGGAKK
jgi:DNA polymerase III sliding clamp (beta) subunit (PCNA family)